MRDVLVPPESAQTLELPERRAVSPFTHSLSDFSQAVLDEGWRNSGEVNMGCFCKISHVTSLLCRATEDGSEDTTSPPQGGAPQAAGGQGGGHPPGENLGGGSGEEKEAPPASSSGRKKRKRKQEQAPKQPRKKKKEKTEEAVEEEAQSSAESSSVTGFALPCTASEARQALGPFRSLDEPLPSLDVASEEDIAQEYRQFQGEVDGMTTEHFRVFHRMLHGLKQSAGRNGDGADGTVGAGGSGDDEESLGESRRQVENNFTLSEAACPDGSSDEEVGDGNYNTQADRDFLHDEEQQNNTNTLHQMCDNNSDRLARDLEGRWGVFGDYLNAPDVSITTSWGAESHTWDFDGC